LVIRPRNLDSGSNWVQTKVDKSLQVAASIVRLRPDDEGLVTIMRIAQLFFGYPQLDESLVRVFESELPDSRTRAALYMERLRMKAVLRLSLCLLRAIERSSMRLRSQVLARLGTPTTVEMEPLPPELAAELTAIHDATWKRTGSFWVEVQAQERAGLFWDKRGPMNEPRQLGKTLELTARRGVAKFKKSLAGSRP
jgi:hypothetical protein